MLFVFCFLFYQMYFKDMFTHCSILSFAVLLACESVDCSTFCMKAHVKLIKMKSLTISVSMTKYHHLSCQFDSRAVLVLIVW